MKRVDKLVIAAICLVAANILIVLEAWSIPQERVQRNTTCEWRKTEGGAEICR